MKIQRRRIAPSLPAFLLLVTVAFAPAALTQDEHVLHSFANSGGDGYAPIGALSFDSVGNLFGTSTEGGVYNAGSVFKLIGPFSQWRTESVAYSFNPNNGDGYQPYGGVIVPSVGRSTPAANAYGTTYLGGQYGAGTVYELVSSKSGESYTESVLHSFNPAGGDGANPASSLIVDADGNFYGTTVAGGADGAGTVFELVSDGTGGFTEQVLYSFSNNGVDGVTPWSTLFMDSEGNLWGTTSAGGAYRCGTVFELTPQLDSTWSETIIHNFAHNSSDGCRPLAGVTLDWMGVWWGATNTGGTHNLGTLYSLTNTDGVWTEAVVHDFAGNGDGAHPGYGSVANIPFDYHHGTTIDGGSGGIGSIYTWRSSLLTYEVSYSFVHDGTNNGFHPYGGPTLDFSGNLYGVTRDGGTDGGGIVYKEAPGPPSF
jgi:uncharacterized repeat protein (TIGR03803 family)